MTTWPQRLATGIGLFAVEAAAWVLVGLVLASATEVMGHSTPIHLAFPYSHLALSAIHTGGRMVVFGPIEFLGYGVVFFLGSRGLAFRVARGFWLVLIVNVLGWSFGANSRHFL